MIIYTCPKCGHDLMNETLTSYPPIHKKYCPKCGWSHSEHEEIVRVPFKENYVNTVYTNNYLPSACDNCSNNPKNGGSGICHCILGGMKVTY